MAAPSSAAAAAQTEHEQVGAQEREAAATCEREQATARDHDATAAHEREAAAHEREWAALATAAATASRAAVDTQDLVRAAMPPSIENASPLQPSNVPVLLHLNWMVVALLMMLPAMSTLQPPLKQPPSPTGRHTCSF